jgi:hypothetical protein
MSPSRILNVLRTIFFVSALGFGAISAFWPKIYPALSKLDWILIKLHTRDAQGAFDEAQAQMAAGDKDGALRTLTDLAGDLEGVRLGDRLSPLRTEVLDNLAAHHQSSGRMEESLVWTQALLEYDPRDFVSMLRRAELLESLGQSDAAFEQMQAAFAVGSTSGAAQLSYIEMLCQRGMREEVAEVLLGLGRRGPLYVPMRGWDFRWCVSARKDFRPRVDLFLNPGEASGDFEAAIPIPGAGLTVRGLRIDLPGSSLAWLGKLRCEVLTEDGVAATLTEQDISFMNDMTEEHGVLVTTGGVDPFVVLYRKDVEAVSGVTGFRVSLQAGSRVPAAAKALLAGPFDPELRAAWSNRYGEAAVLALESVQ